MQFFSRYLGSAAEGLCLLPTSYHRNKMSSMSVAKPVQEWPKSSQCFSRHFKGNDVLPPLPANGSWRGHYYSRGRMWFPGRCWSTDEGQLLHFSLTKLPGLTAALLDRAQMLGPLHDQIHSDLKLKSGLPITKWKQCCFPEHSRSFTMYWGACFSSPLSYEQQATLCFY